MKRIQISILIVIGAVLGGLVLVAMGSYSGRTAVQYPFALLRQEADEDPNTTIGSTDVNNIDEGDYANMPDQAQPISADNARNTVGLKVHVIAAAGSAADKTFTIEYWGYAYWNGPAQLLCSVAYTTGTKEVVKYPHSRAAATGKYWADTAVVTSYIGYEIVVNDHDGDNGMAEVIIPAMGLEYLCAVVHNADGATGNEGGDVSAYYRLRN